MKKRFGFGLAAAVDPHGDVFSGGEKTSLKTVAKRKSKKPCLQSKLQSTQNRNKCAREAPSNVTSEPGEQKFVCNTCHNVTSVRSATAYEHETTCIQYVCMQSAVACDTHIEFQLH